MTTVEINTANVSKPYNSSSSDQTTVTTAVSDFSTPSSLYYKDLSKPHKSSGSRSSGSKDGKSRRRRRRNSERRRSKKANRGILMGLVAQEMANSWRDGDDDETEQSNQYLGEHAAPPTGDAAVYSAADVFYAQMNGEQLQSDSTMHSGSIRTYTSNSTNSSGDDDTDDLLLEDDDDLADFADHTSFAGLALPENVLEDDGDDDAANLDASERSSRSCHKKKDRHDRAVPEDLSISRKSKNSLGALSSKYSSGSSSDSSTDDALSIQEIQDIVMAQMPESIRNKIPKEAWGRIFNTAVAVNNTRKPTNVAPMEDDDDAEDEKQEEKAKDDDDDNLSVISDITMHTTPHNNNKVAVPLAPYEEEERLFFENYKEEPCPMLPPFDHASAAGSRDSSKDLSYRSRGSSRASKRSSTTTHSVANHSTASSSSKKSNGCDGVRFGNVQVRYYERIMDVNPSVTTGVAIGIGWRYKRGGTISVNEWENQRGQTRQANELVIPKHVRDQMLKDVGYTQKDFAAATRIILKAKHNRKTTVMNRNHQHMEEAVENAARRVMGLLSFGRKKGLV